MLVTVVRSYVAYPVELPDGAVLRPFKFLEYMELPAEFRPDEKTGKGGIADLVDGGQVKVHQMQDIAPEMTMGTIENRLPSAVGNMGRDNPTGPQVGDVERKRIDDRDATKPDIITPGSKPGMLTEQEASMTTKFRQTPEEVLADKVSITQLARGVLPSTDLTKSENTIKVAETVQARTTQKNEPLKAGETVKVNVPVTAKPV